jgi:hypothetical protein
MFFYSNELASSVSHEQNQKKVLKIQEFFIIIYEAFYFLKNSCHDKQTILFIKTLY